MAFDFNHPKSLPLLPLKPALEWSLILGFGLLCGACLLVKVSAPLRLLYPAGAFLISLVLYTRQPVLYLGFTWWLWFTSAGVRRLVDYQSGWQDPSYILLAPYLATLVAGLTVFKELPTAHRRGSLPFIIAFASVVYGGAIGVINLPIMAVVVKFLDWVVPVIFGCYVYSHWRRYPQFKANLTRVFRWGVLVMGSYGIWQYLVAPAWDSYWIEQTELLTFGRPEPLAIRVFSTMHSNGPFAVTVMAGLILLFNSPGMVSYSASAVGYLSFLLSLTRSAWIGWFFALITFTSALKSSLQLKMVMVIFAMALCALPLTVIEPFSGVISARLETFTAGGSDVSFQERTEKYQEMLGESLSQITGNGLGGSADHIDSAILEMFFSLGWVGTLPYLLGLFTLLFSAFQVTAVRFDPFASASRAIALGVTVQLVFGSVMLGVSGMVLWTFLGMVLAAQKYYRQHPGQVTPDRPPPAAPTRTDITLKI
ncbi:glucose-6-phosphate isomerase [filamentous cyanobacterium CCP5]|nr:glucose-6-phosphate isomerase [filamentous cyanobacterium CCP5]